MQQYISSPGKTAEILSRYGIRLRKSLGQNYIIDTNIIKKLVSLAHIGSNEAVLEIGSGIGSLTEIIMESGAARVVCIEVDKRVAEVFRDVFSDEIEKGKVILFMEDAMDIDYAQLSSKYGIEKMVSNLPYKIAAPILLKILGTAPEITSFWVTIQKDISDRILAERGKKDYSSYTIKTNLLADFRKCFKVSRNCFMPKPHVDSVVVEITRKELPEIFENGCHIQDFFDLVNGSFLHRRKKILNSLASGTRFRDRLDSIKNLLEELGKGPSVRAQDLSLEDYLHIFRGLQG